MPNPNASSAWQTGGGDCPGLNAVIRAVVKAAAKRGWEAIGFLDGYEGLLDLRYRSLDYHEMDGLLHLGGTILGATNKGRFAAKTGHGEVRKIPEAILERTKHNIEQLGLRGGIFLFRDGAAGLRSLERLF